MSRIPWANLRNRRNIQAGRCYRAKQSKNEPQPAECGVLGHVRFCGICVVSCGAPAANLAARSNENETRDGARTATELRMLRQGSAARLHTCAHLHLRVHLLRRLRRDHAEKCLPELRRRLYAATDPAGDGMASGAVGCEASAIDEARAPLLQSRRDPRAQRAYPAYSTGSALRLARVVSRRSSRSLRVERMESQARDFDQARVTTGLCCAATKPQRFQAIPACCSCNVITATPC
jgi:hypothetical protein